MDEENARAHVIRPLHATAVNLAINNSDFVLVFIQVLPFFEQGALVPKVGFEPVTAISLSPVVAKQLRTQLDRAISEFENNTGANIPDIGTLSKTDGQGQSPT